MDFFFFVGGGGKEKWVVIRCFPLEMVTMSENEAMGPWAQPPQPHGLATHQTQTKPLHDKLECQLSVHRL